MIAHRDDSIQKMSFFQTVGLDASLEIIAQVNTKAKHQQNVGKGRFAKAEPPATNTGRGRVA